MKQITDKKAIKNGMYFQLINKEYYIKVGERCCKLDIKNTITFSDVSQEEISAIFKHNGKLLVE